MAMKLVKKTEEYSIYLRGDQRYAVKDADRKPINGDEKTRILLEESLIKVALPAEKPAEETDAGESAAGEESAEAAAGETSAEEAPAAAADEGDESGEDK